MQKSAIQQRHTAHFRLLITLLPVVLVLSIIGAVAIGPVSLSLLTVGKALLLHLPLVGHFTSLQVTHTVDVIVWQLRLPRVLLGALVGGGLGLAGTAIQALVRNSLADPYILGVSSGAAIGATLVIVFGAFSIFGAWALAIAAFGGALAAMALVFALSQVAGRITTTRLILSGVVLSLVFGSVASMTVLAAPQGGRIRSALFWLMGSLTGATWTQLPIVAVVVAAGFLYLLLESRALNLLLMGEETATTLGVNVQRFRKSLVVCISLLTGVLVSVSGAIGFVGLMIPHLARLLVGPAHKRVVPTSLLLGAVFMIWADVIARMAMAPEEIPIGVITALCGGPFFIWLLRRNRYSFGG